jgi:hypothetical protein
MICPGVRGGAGLVPVVGLIRSLSARVERDSSQTCRHGSLHPDRRAPGPLPRFGGSIGMLADQVDHVIGVDTHCDSHELAVVAASSGGVVARSSQRATPHGYAQALRFAASHASGVRVWAIEGSGHYESAFARLAGAAPIPASSGHTSRHRLSRGGDRQLNRARRYGSDLDPAVKSVVSNHRGHSRNHASRQSCLAPFPWSKAAGRQASVLNTRAGEIRAPPANACGISSAP